MRKKRSVFCPALLAMVAMCFAGCGTEDAVSDEIELLAPVEAVVDIETVMYRDLYTIKTKDAELAPYTEELSFGAGGQLSHLYVEIGSEVKAGDLLAEQEEEGVRSAANAALDKYLAEKKVYMDAVKGVKKKLATNLSKEERDRQELIMAQAEELWEMQEPGLWAAWEEARARVGNSKIYAPYDGVVTACLNVGTTVAAGQPVVAVADTERLYATANSYLSPSEYANYERVYGLVNGKETELTYEEAMMEEEGTYTYYTPKELNGAKMGDFILVCMVSNYHPQVLSIPEHAIYRDSGGSYVYLIEDGTRIRRDVTEGYKGEVYVEITDGLQEGDKVYVKN